VETRPLFYPDPVPFLDDIDILQEVGVPFDLDSRFVALGYHYLGGAADGDVLKVIYATFLCPDIPISSYSFTKDITAGRGYY